MVIGKGRLLSDGSMDDLRKQVSHERCLIVDLAHGHETIDEDQVTIVERSGPRVTMAFHPSEISPAELIARITARHEVRDLFVEHPPIEEIIAELYALHELDSGDGAP